ncbi:hypothetical protein LIA77_00247 [Sarocladium implicatum]|nr:hypothetical protein LIA77_00247 [Sarocladium implicatum]
MVRRRDGGPVELSMGLGTPRVDLFTREGLSPTTGVSGAKGGEQRRDRGAIKRLNRQERGGRLTSDRNIVRSDNGVERGWIGGGLKVRVERDNGLGV